MINLIYDAVTGGIEIREVEDIIEQITQPTPTIEERISTVEEKVDILAEAIV